MLSLRNPTGRNTKAHIVSVAGSTYYFSYETCIAFSGYVNGEFVRVRRSNDWGATTGRHFKELGCHDYDIIPTEEFSKLMDRPFSVDYDSLLTDATAAAIRQARPAGHKAEAGSYQAGFDAGIESAREYIARLIADAVEDRCDGMFRRNEFFRSCGTLELG